MAAQMVARAIFMRRQRDGVAGGVVESRGGRVRDLPGNLFGDDGDDQPCVDPGSRELRLLGRQHIEAGQTLEPFEGQLNLPAKAIENEDVGRREAVGRQRGKEKNVLRRLETTRVGLPAALPSPRGTLVAFTAKTPSGAALFLYSGGSMARVFPTGTLTPLGPVTYLSPGRPGLMLDGTTAVLAGCARTPAIFRLTRQRLDLRIQRGQLTPFGTELESLGDPVLTASGAMFVGATDSYDHEKLFELSGDDEFFEVGEAEMIYRIALGASRHHSIFTGTLTVNQHGDFAYLGGR